MLGEKVRQLKFKCIKKSNFSYKFRTYVYHDIHKDVYCLVLHSQKVKQIQAYSQESKKSKTEYQKIHLYYSKCIKTTLSINALLCYNLVTTKLYLVIY